MESGCVDCGFPCLRSACPHYLVEVHCCDECGEEFDGLDEVYEVDDKELCEDCLKDLFRKR